jgi:hypothetical protein
VSDSRKITPIQSEVALPCAVARGTFPTERWVKVDARFEKKPLPITAFVPIGYVYDPKPNTESSRKGSVDVHVSFRHNGHSGLIFPGELLSVSNPVTVDSIWLDEVSIRRPPKG